MPDKQQLHHLIDQLPESEISAAARYLEFLLAHEAPVDPDLLARIDRARDQPSPGISHSDVLREFGLCPLSGSPQRAATCDAWTETPQ
jgi:hypothetical protein